jgi:hypothetical protein
MEEWRPVVDYEGRYEVSDQGRVRNTQTGIVRILSLSGKPGCRYASVDWKTAGRKEYFRVHHLVLEAFVGPRPSGMHACHRDDDRLNNHVTNLYWGTQADNMQDRLRNGNNPWASKTHCSKCGHELAGINARLRRSGRVCRVCARHRSRVDQGYYLGHPEEWPDWAGSMPAVSVLLDIYRKKKGRDYPIPPRQRDYAKLF